MSFEIGTYPDSLKIAKITPAYKSGYSSSLSNYRPISVLRFSNVSCIDDFIVTYRKIFYSKQFGFQTGHSNDHLIIQLVEQIYENFEGINTH